MSSVVILLLPHQVAGEKNFNSKIGDLTTTKIPQRTSTPRFSDHVGNLLPAHKVRLVYGAVVMSTINLLLAEDFPFGERFWIIFRRPPWPLQEPPRVKVPLHKVLLQPPQQVS